MKIALRFEGMIRFDVVLAVFMAITGCTAPASRSDVLQSHPASYPNLNIPILPAMEQLSPEEKERLARELAAKRKQGAAVASNEAEYQRRLARERQAATLRQIKGSINP